MAVKHRCAGIGRMRWCIFIVLLFSGEWACSPYPRSYSGAWARDENETRASEKVSKRSDYSEPVRLRHKVRGIASFMADETHGRQTANGEMYDMRQMVGAHLTLPFNTVVAVRNLENGQEVEVRINDRGPYVRGRIIDLSFEAAKQLGFIEKGSAEVEIEIIKLP